MADDLLTYDERIAVQTIRKSLLKGRTHVLAAVAKDLSKEAAVAMLLEAQKNLRVLLEVTKAMGLATEHLRSSVDSKDN